MTTAIGYVRVSTQDQAREGFSLSEQRARITQETRRRRWTLTQIIADEGESGRDLDRPGLAEALEILGDGDADTLIVAKLDRLSRSLLDFASLMARAQGERWALVALDLGVDMTTPSGQLISNVMASFAEFERHLIRERTAAGRLEKARRGEGWVVGRVPFGYSPSDRGLVLDPRAVEAVRLIFTQSARGRDARSIAQILDDASMPSPGGVGWDAQAVRRIRRRSIYCGYYDFKGHRVPAPAIVTRRTWRRAQEADRGR